MTKDNATGMIQILDRVAFLDRPDLVGVVHTVFPDRTFRVEWDDGKVTRTAEEQLVVLAHD